jgi:amidase
MNKPYTLPELCRFEAVPLAGMLRRKEVSAVEIMMTYLDHIEAVNPAVNAIVSMRPREELIAEAEEADLALARNEDVGPLHGIPQAIKDLAQTKGLRSTLGCLLFENFIPEEDSIYVARMREAGAIIMGKTNVPELGLGSNSYNPIFGLTRNAWNPDHVGGGSSGGAGVSLALRMLPVADGSDMGGSLRNPAAFNNVYGFRVSQDLIPMDGPEVFYSQMPVVGPMGRSVEDLAMLLSVQAGYHARAPLSLDYPAGWLDGLTPADPKKLRIGWLGDFGGYLPFEDGVPELTRKAVGMFEGAGAQVEDVEPFFDMAQLWEAFLTLRSQRVGGKLHQAYQNPKLRALLKPEAIWEVERSLGQSGLDVYNASVVRTSWYHTLLRMFESYDYLVLPSAQVFPYKAGIDWPEEIAGRRMDSYHRWMEVVIGSTMSGCPAISVPAGFNEKGLPTGFQIIGRPRGDRKVLEAALLYEQISNWLGRLPPMIG